MTSEEAVKVAEIRRMILDEAHTEESRLVHEAEAAAAALREQARTDVARESQALTKRLAEEVETDKRARLAAAVSAGRSRALHARAEVLQEAVRAAHAHMARFRGDSAYPEYLKALLTEAALALAPHEQLEVAIDARDEGIITNDFLGSVEIVLTFSHNLGVHLTLAKERIVTLGGVIVRVRDSHMRCDNTFEERLRAATPSLLRLVASQVLTTGFSDGTER